MQKDDKTVWTIFVLDDGPLWYDSQYKPDLVEEKKPGVPAVEVTLKNEEVLAPLGSDSSILLFCCKIFVVNFSLRRD